MTPASAPCLKISVPAAKEQLLVVRSAAAATAAIAQLELDDINDLRLAIDEASTQLLKYASPNATLSCSMHNIGPAGAVEALRVTVSIWPVSAEPVRERTFGWHILEVLTDTVDMTVADSLSPHDQVMPAIVFTKRCNMSADIR